MQSFILLKFQNYRYSKHTCHSLIFFFECCILQINVILDYLLNRPQFVRMGNCRSPMLTSSSGAPQGTVLWPFLFSLCTTDFFYNSGTCHMQKFSDDIAIVACIKGENGGIGGVGGMISNWTFKKQRSCCCTTHLYVCPSLCLVEEFIYIFKKSNKFKFHITTAEVLSTFNMTITKKGLWWIMAMLKIKLNAK